MSWKESASWKSSVDERKTVTAGCLFALGSALLTSMMLFINGSLVMAIITAMQRSGMAWIDSPQLSQFLLFTVPVMLVIVQWLMIDYVRTRVRR